MPSEGLFVGEGPDEAKAGGEEAEGTGEEACEALLAGGALTVEVEDLDRGPAHAGGVGVEHNPEHLVGEAEQEGGADDDGEGFDGEEVTGGGEDEGQQEEAERDGDHAEVEEGGNGAVFGEGDGGRATTVSGGGGDDTRTDACVLKAKGLLGLGDGSIAGGALWLGTRRIRRAAAARSGVDVAVHGDDFGREDARAVGLGGGDGAAHFAGGKEFRLVGGAEGRLFRAGTLGEGLAKGLTRRAQLRGGDCGALGGGIIDGSGTCGSGLHAAPAADAAMIPFRVFGLAITAVHLLAIPGERTPSLLTSLSVVRQSQLRPY